MRTTNLIKLIEPVYWTERKGNRKEQEKFDKFGLFCGAVNKNKKACALVPIRAFEAAKQIEVTRT